MSIDPESFDAPVKDYDFSAIADGDNAVHSLIDQMATAGGFTATKLATARTILEDMKQQINAANSDPKQVANWLSFPACLCATGTRGFFVESLRQQMFNVVSTTCGMLDHDIARAYKHYYHGAFELDDIELGEHGLMRLGNVIVPNESYGEIIEAMVMPVLEEIRNDRIAAAGLNVDEDKIGADLWLGFGSAHLIWELGERIGTPDTLIYWAAKHRIPVVIPGITDGSIGAQLFMFRQRHSEFHLDTLADEQVLSDITWTTETSNALMVGGGISKHHVIWWNQYRGGLDSAVYITTAPEHDGSLSGARLREAISWGKMRPEAPNVCVEGDASVLLPLLGADLFN
ncbi:MAG: deoxyhypusine synthase [Candidatus Poseidoniaceae archaeon]|jgi:deoxyhypusine synthase|nr:deoxyhypusine synthase [Candidatus Poseidoniaceae archaeon]MDP7001602.1 deoxyhypusine synthase [Candidatus Poseidoniaceae archaeon]